ncbi:hypothetical protein SAMN05444157_3078 [Frankineae bacterium MT45]|nr:hypothetical protein SAMN05444157_3078 [Frankineae bacterium MT45]
MPEPPELAELTHARPSRRAYVRVALGLVVVVGIVSIASLKALSYARSRDPHGNPDPGGRRLASLASIAQEAVPNEASSTHLTVTKSSWGHGGCDGGAPGWTNMEVIETFRGPVNVVAEVDAKMNTLHWRIVSKLSPSPAGEYPPPAAPGPDAPYAREYQPISDSDTQVAWLFTPTQAGTSSWELDLEAPPAEVPDHSC